MIAIALDVNIIPIFVLADLDENGTLDLLTHESPSTPALLSGNGDGTFVSSIAFAPDEQNSYFLPADFDGDGHVDVARPGTRVTPNFQGRTVVELLMGNGDLTFAAPPHVYRFDDIDEVADMDLDGIPDLVGLYGVMLGSLGE